VRAGRCADQGHVRRWLRRCAGLAPQWDVDVLVVDKAGRWRSSPGLVPA
jgi:hypothetical protein